MAGKRGVAGEASGQPESSTVSRPRARILPQTAYRLEQVEGWLANGHDPRQCQRLAMKTWGCGRRHATRYVSLAFARWAEESQNGRPEKRDQMRATLWAGYRRCLEVKGLALDKHGGEHEYDAPDMKAAAKYLELLCRLDGLLEQDGSGGEQIPEMLANAMQRIYFGLNPVPEVVEARARVVENKQLKEGSDHE